MRDGPVQSYRDLLIWQRGMKLVEDCYRMTGCFPREEMFGSTAQLRRASVSVPANIAEGFGRDTTGSFVQFLRTAQGSLKELETHLLIAQRVGLAREQVTAPLLSECDEIGRMLRAFIRSIQQTARNGN